MSPARRPFSLPRVPSALRLVTLAASLWNLGCASSPRPLAAGGGRSRVVLASSLHWAEVRRPDGSALGFQAAAVWGDPAKGAYGALARYPAGFREPLHLHTRDLRTLVLAGTMRYEIQGGESADLTRGSHVTIAAGVPHRAVCAGAEPCESYVQQDGAMDVVPVR